MRKIATVLLAGALFLGVTAGSALASGGSVYVTSDCFYPSLQDNSIVQGDLVYVWVKSTGPASTPTFWTTVDNPGNNTQSGDLTVTDCTRDGGKYVLYLADGFDSSVLGSYTLSAWDQNSVSISSDSFRIVPSSG